MDKNILDTGMVTKLGKALSNIDETVALLKELNAKSKLQINLLQLLLSEIRIQLPALITEIKEMKDEIKKEKI